MNEQLMSWPYPLFHGKFHKNTYRGEIFKDPLHITDSKFHAIFLQLHY